MHRHYSSHQSGKACHGPVGRHLPVAVTRNVFVLLPLNVTQ